MKNLKVGQRVAKQTSKNDEYWIGNVTKINGNKALVSFPTRSLSRWCNITNLKIVIKL
jgi:hypothetical protein